MAVPRKIYIPPLVPGTSPDTTVRIQHPGAPSPFRASTGGLATKDELQAETNARIAADSAEATARANADSAEATARTNADNLEITNRTNAINSEASTRASQDSTLQTNINNEASTRAAGDTAAHWMGLDLSGLPTANPGGGKPWLSGGVIRIGP